jgi:hypothetical protein
VFPELSPPLAQHKKLPCEAAVSCVDSCHPADMALTGQELEQAPQSKQFSGSIS